MYLAAPLLLAGVVCFLAMRDHRLPDIRDPDPAPTPSPLPAEPETPPPTVAAPAPPEEAEARVSSRFQRRLAAGAALRALRQRVAAGEAGERELDAGLRAVLPDLLQVDGLDNLAALPAAELLRALTSPCCDADALSLTRADPNLGDPLAAGDLLRVWQRGDPCDPAEVEAALSMLRHLVARTGFVPGHGYDVLWTPQMGADLLPRRHGPRWAAGVYFPQDLLAVVDSSRNRPFRAKVLRHELVHAFLHDRAPAAVRRAFFGEGLAELLSQTREGCVRLTPSIESLRPRLARSARLIEWLEKAGISLRFVRLGAFARLPPDTFYILRNFAYAVAEATMAAVGPEPVEAALLGGGEAPLLSAVDALGWQGLLEFLRSAAAGVDAAPEEPLIDLLLTAEDCRRSPIDLLRRSLDEIGALHDPESSRRAAAHLGFPESAPADAEATASRIERSERPVLVLFDLSPAMEGPFVPRGEEQGRGDFLGTLLRGATERRDVARNLLAALGDRARPFALAAPREPRATLADRAPISWLALREALRTVRGAEADLVLLVAAREGPDGAARDRELLLDSLVAERARIGDALVIDLGGGAGGPSAVFRALLDATEQVRSVAYWAPAAE